MGNKPNQDYRTLLKPVVDAIDYTMTTNLGKLHIRGPVSPECLSGYQFSGGLCCFRPPGQQHAALIELAKEPDGIVFASALSQKIVAYITFQKPDFPWWIRRCFPRLLELGCIETDLSLRNMGLSKILMDSVFKNPDFSFFEDYIIIAIHTVDSWDLKNTCLSPWDYRRFILKMFKQYAFIPWETEDPEITEHPCNTLLARIGTRIEPVEIEHFSKCCQGLN